MEYWTALSVGLVGSLHCIGMCGPIAIALPPGAGSRVNHVVGRVLYNSGRIITYGFMGLIAGLVGKTVNLGGYQQLMSIVLGVLILLAVILPSRFGALLTGSKVHARIMEKFKTFWGRLFGRRTSGSMFVVGLLNGFLPCGLVYVALAGAIATGSVAQGGIYMVLFGLGTFPVMLAMSLIGKLVGSGFKVRMRNLLPIGGAILAVLFILRGLSLGIPYISPEIEQNQQGETTVNCCHQNK